MKNYEPCNCPRNVPIFGRPENDKKRCELMDTIVPNQGWEHASCDFTGNDYRLCPRLIKDREEDDL